MNMVEFGNNLDPDKEFDVLHSILDFPMECLEEDEDAEDWDISNPESLGPIPSNVLMGPTMMSDEMFKFQRPNLFPRPVAPITGVPEPKQLPKHVDISGFHIHPLRKFAKVQESPSWCTQSPVSVLESSGSHPRERSLSIKSGNVPVRGRSKRVRYAGINPWIFAAHELSTSKQTPTARKSRESRKILCQKPVAMDLLKNSPITVDNSLDVLDPAHMQNTSKKCSHCQSTKTPQWRWGPLGRNTLCNACGVRYRSGRLFPEYRPAASPTFAQSQHSNSHRKVTEMRNKANLSTDKIKIENVRALERKQLAKHVDTSVPLISTQIVGAFKQKKIGKADNTRCSHIPLQNKHTNVEESCPFCAGNCVSILEINGSCSRDSQLSFMSSRSKRVKPADNPLLLALPSTCKKTSNATRGEESNKKTFQLPVTMDVPNNCPTNDENSLDVSDPASLKNTPKCGNARTKKCAHCQSTKTPQWREGPLGPRTLCNACGVRYRSGRLVPEYRPAASPTFVPSKHSNLHSKVVQMIKAEHTSLRPGIETKVSLTSARPEYVHE